ncbi:MAG: (deoxy)nucleoside triphosphate pyrophosphohydrolase [Planctomycetia bacterium]|nr:(deoxy)nucleoside triphosphate pyrophosphohydrolase [Planctomycetia bacterium]
MTTRIAVAVIHYDGKFLIGRRPPDAPLGGLWEFPGGKLKQGESPMQAAVREAREETGIAVVPCYLYQIVHHQYDHDQVELHFMACRPADGAGTPKAPFLWVPRADLIKYRFPEANAAVLRTIMRYA